MNRTFFIQEDIHLFYVLTWLYIKKTINIYKSFKEIMSVFWLCQMYTVYIIDGFRYIGYLYTSVKLSDAWVLVSNQTVQCCLNCKFKTLGPICICLLNADLLCFNMYIFYYHAWLEADTHSASPQTHVWSPLCNKRNEALTKMPVLKLCFCLSKRIANLSKTAVYIDEMLCILCQ